MTEPRRPEDGPSRRTAKHGSWGVVLIGACKLLTGLLMAAAGFGIFHYLDRDLRTVAEQFVALIRLDPDSRVVHTIVSTVSGIDRKHLREIGLGTFFYALLHLVEGTGLVLRRRWAEYLTVVSTGWLIPVEAYVAVRRMNVAKLFVLFVNVLIVIYIIVKLVQQHRARERDGGADPATVASGGPRGGSRIAG